MAQPSGKSALLFYQHITES